ncbi:MAG: hypothetical protein CVT64_00425 [Actinobacteria bacterium HGW-Actinobacteria-4]|nr:MAG: hypothetical protein CVT64_00425 [Actinobacteria bacterium HGW-Actinobacteria-4]
MECYGGALKFGEALERCLPGGLFVGECLLGISARLDRHFKGDSRYLFRGGGLFCGDFCVHAHRRGDQFRCLDLLHGGLRLDGGAVERLRADDDILKTIGTHECFELTKATAIAVARHGNSAEFTARHGE